ncbi:hypothetical protein [Dyella sp. EPa41]|uniref:hypothetical protein n=1 Tax=Dyella sp. EPa41 TaxID=1561194 RepID=UPI001915DCB7|nr:hypothetical protein [Dyella sp. EPa41]
MSKWKSKVLTVTSAIKASAGEMTDRVADTSKGMVAAGKEQLTSLTEKTLGYWNELEWSELTNAERHRERFERYYAISSEKVVSYYRSALEVDKSTEQMVDDIRRKLPVPAQTFDDIFQQCKNEALRRAVAVFCLAPVMQGLDRHAEGRYANLSLSYKEFKAENNLHDHPNFAELKNEQYQAQRDWTLLDNGYQHDLPVNPFDTDIEHIIPKSQLYDDWIVRLGTNDDQFIDVINTDENLIFADRSINRSKGASDLLDYIDRGVPDSKDPDILHFSIKGEDHTVRRSDIEKRYEEASERATQARLDALKVVGVEVASVAATMAAQQVVGLMVVETIDIFVDEVKDLAATGKLLSSEGLLADLQVRQERLSTRLVARFEERKIWDRARAVGIEGAVAGALSAIPQILISILTNLPALVLSIVRECTLSTVRCVRLLMAPGDAKLEGIKVIMLGTVSAVMGVYVAHLISKGIRAVPIFRAYDREVSLVLSSLIVTAVPLVAIYGFERNKAKFTFRLLPGSASASEQAEYNA